MNDTPSGARMRWIRRAWSLLPGLPELVPTQLTMVIVLIPLCLYRWSLAQVYDADAGLVDMSGGELQFWMPVGLIAALALRWAPRRMKFGLQVVFQLLCFVLVALNGFELAFFGIFGTRIDWDALGFLLGDIENVAPVALSELQAVQVVAAIGLLVLCLLPLAARVRRDPPWGMLVGIPALSIALWIAHYGRATQRGPLKELQPSLEELLYWDGLDRLGDTTIAPQVSDVQERVVRPTGADRPNIVLILLESVGWQATSFGGQYATTPNLAQFAEGGLVADHMYSVVPHTSKALVTTMCGDWPLLRSEIGESRAGGQPGRCLPELLRDLGYATGFFQTANEAFESRTELIHRFGFQFFRGRDSLLASPKSAGYAKANYFGLEDRAMLQPGIDWATRQKEPFFAAYLTLATHHDYGVLPDWTYPAIAGKSGRELHYLNNIRYSDDFLKRLVAGYAEQGLAENTVFVVLGDHGEAFGQHSRFVHDMVIYDEGLHIPLVMWGPGVPRGTIDGNRQQIDVLPTLIQLAGGTLSGSVRGSTLLGPAPDRILHHSCWRSHRCLAERDMAGVKLIDLYGDGPMQLFNTADDPLEVNNLAGTLMDKGARRTELRDWRASVNGRYDELEERWVNHDQRPDASPAQHHWSGMDMVRCGMDQAYAVPGQTFWVTCSWRPDAPLRSSWPLYVRFGGAVTTVRPLLNVWPTWKWRPGWSVDDSFPVLVPAEATAGEMPIEVSWDDVDWATVGVMPVVLD